MNNGLAYSSRIASLGDVEYHAIDTDEILEKTNVQRGSATTSGSYNWVTGG